MTLSRLLRALSPWSGAESVRFLCFVAAGAAVCLVGWWAAEAEESFGDQIKWANVGVAGFVATAFGAVTWLLRARWAIAQRRLALLTDVSLAATTPAQQLTADPVVAAPDRGRFHRPGCALTKGRSWPAIARASATADGRLPCGVCRP